MRCFIFKAKGYVLPVFLWLVVANLTQHSCENFRTAVM